MDKENLEKWVREAINPFKVYQFNEAQFEQLVDIIDKRKIADDYEETFITFREAENMMLFETEQLLKTMPHLRSSPKPPGQPD